MKVHFYTSVEELERDFGKPCNPEYERALRVIEATPPGSVQGVAMGVMTKAPSDDHLLHVEIAGHTEPMLDVDASSVRCGEIKDGIGFNIGQEGWWAISFADLERIYHAAVEARPEIRLRRANNGGKW